MKAKLLLSASLIALISTNSFAAEMYKAKIIKHKEWATGGAKASFKPADITSFKSKIQKKFQEDNHIGILSAAYASTNNGKVGDVVSINGEGFVFIRNDTDQTLSYRYFFSSCAQTSPNTSLCSYYFNDVELESGGYVFDGEEPALQIQMDKSGSYPTYMSTNVFPLPNSQGPYQVNVDSTSSGFVNITDGDDKVKS